MGIGLSILVAAVGAVMRYALTTTTQGIVNLHTGGVILMFAGAVGLVVSMLFWSSFAPFGRRTDTSSRREEVVTEDGHAKGRVISETHDHVAN